MPNTVSLFMDNGRIMSYLKHPRHNDNWDQLRSFSYRKITKFSDKNRSNPKAMVYAWEITYNGSPIIVKDTLREVKSFIFEEARS